MARGITENDVWTASDTLLLEGARPTIERVRQKIGRGSPNTVSPYLDTWFKNLGGRIKDPGAFSAPPDLPDPIIQVAKHLWEVAQAESRRDFDERLRNGMAAAILNVEAEKERAALAEAAAFEASAKVARLQADLAHRESSREQEALARSAAEARLGDALGQVEHLQARVVRAEEAADEARTTAKRTADLAIERAASAERRAALEIDSERVARAKADKRADALERKLEAVQDAARSDLVKHTEDAARLKAEVGRQIDAVRNAEERESELTRRVEQLAVTADTLRASLAAVDRDAHAVNQQTALAERIISAIQSRATSRAVGTATKARPAKRPA